MSMKRNRSHERRRELHRNIHMTCVMRKKERSSEQKVNHQGTSKKKKKLRSKFKKINFKFQDTQDLEPTAEPAKKNILAPNPFSDINK